MKVICCMCRKLKGETGWEEKSFEGENSRISHGLCPDCYQKVLLQAEKIVASSELTNKSG